MLFTGLSVSLSLSFPPHLYYIMYTETGDFLPDCWGVFQKNLASSVSQAEWYLQNK